MKKILISIILLITSSLVLADWGATPLSDNDRPKRGWIKSFSKAKIRLADENRNIQDTINACPRSGYCIVKVKKKNSPYPAFYLNHSKTKIMGISDNNNSKPEIHITKPDNESATYIWIDNDNADKSLKEVIIENLSLVGRKIDGRGNSLKGIIVQSSNISKIQIIKNNIDGIQVIGSTANNNDIAFTEAIGVQGTGNKDYNTITDIIIENNIVTNMRTGNSESVNISGNVKNWEIKNNQITDVDNIAIDAGGNGKNAVDAARYGFIEGNTVKEFVFPEDYRAAAIYIDGGKYIHVEGNSTINTGKNYTKGNQIGYQIGAENCMVASHITMVNNHSLINAKREDLMIGGWGKVGCDGSDDGVGSIAFITVKNNNFKQTTMSYRISHAIIDESGVKEVNQRGDGFVPKKHLPNGNAIKTNKR